MMAAASIEDVERMLQLQVNKDRLKADDVYYKENVTSGNSQETEKFIFS